MPNPLYGFDFADKFKEFLPTTGADQCGGCFSASGPRSAWSGCSWPALAACSRSKTLTSLSATSPRPASPTAAGTSARGPRGAELLTYDAWRAADYDAGFVDDARLFDSYASTFIDRRRELGGGVDEFFPELVQASHNWQSVRSIADKVLNTRVEDPEQEKAARLCTTSAATTATSRGAARGSGTRRTTTTSSRASRSRSSRGSSSSNSAAASSTKSSATPAAGCTRPATTSWRAHGPRRVQEGRAQASAQLPRRRQLARQPRLCHDGLAHRAQRVCARRRL